MPSFSTVVNEPNIFSEQQEEWLGEIIDPQIKRSFNLIQDPESDYLQKLGQRLLSQLPATTMHYHFVIIDLPGNDSFGIGGGYIYLSRKIIALAQNEDELAGLLGHEIGHVITHQAGIDITRQLRWVLNVTQLGDRQDILDKWNRLLDSAAKNPEKFDNKREQQEQLIADRIALYAMARSGYQPSRFVDLFSRLIQNEHNKSSFWSRLFGKANPDIKRLQEMVRNSAPMPSNCVTPMDAGSNQHFLKWQRAVIEAKFVPTKEDLPGLVAKTELKPRLRSILDLLRFSPDGKYLLAQDESSIHVFTGNPVTTMFDVEAPDTFEAQFSPDSRSVVFYDKELRVQSWNIETGKRNSIYQVAAADHCLQTKLSHSGEMLACLTRTYEVQLIEVKSSTAIFKGKKLRKPSQYEEYVISVLSDVEGEAFAIFNLQFSADDRYFIAGHEDSAVGYDLVAHNEVELRRTVKAVVGSSFAFLPTGEIAGYDRDHPRRISIVQFPSGEVIDSFATGLEGELLAPAKGNYLVVFQPGPIVSLLDLKTKRVTLTRKTPAFSVYDQIFAGESASGEISVFTLADGKYTSGIDLPDGPLDGTQASAFSPDGKWVAVSGKTRGAIWKVESGERTRLTPAFDGAFFDQEQLIAKCPVSGGLSSPMVKMQVSGKEMQNLYYLSANPGHGATLQQIFSASRSFQLGELVVRMSFEWDKKNSGHALIEVFDAHDNKKLWERKVEKARPGVFYSNTGKTLTLLIANYESIKAEAAADPKVNARLNGISSQQGKKDSYVLRILDAKTGDDLGAILVDSGNLSFKVRAAFAVADTVLVADSLDRTLVYSLKSGDQRGKVFGEPRGISRAGDKMLIQNGKGILDLYDTSNLQSAGHFAFPSRLIRADFLEDDNLFILTADQTIYKLKSPSKEQAAGVK